MTPRWLKLKDAAEYTSIGTKRLIMLAEEGQVRGFQDPDSRRGDWIFDRLSLDAYREGQFASSGVVAVEQKSLAILRSLGQ
jgi:hypothetical protein